MSIPVDSAGIEEHLLEEYIHRTKPFPPLFSSRFLRRSEYIIYPNHYNLKYEIQLTKQILLPPDSKMLSCSEHIQVSEPFHLNGIEKYPLEDYHTLNKAFSLLFDRESVYNQAFRGDF